MRQRGDPPGSTCWPQRPGGSPPPIPHGDWGGRPGYRPPFPPAAPDPFLLWGAPPPIYANDGPHPWGRTPPGEAEEAEEAEDPPFVANEAEEPPFGANAADVAAPAPPSAVSPPPPRPAPRRGKAAETAAAKKVVDAPRRGAAAKKDAARPPLGTVGAVKRDEVQLDALLSELEAANAPAKLAGAKAASKAARAELEGLAA